MRLFRHIGYIVFVLSTVIGVKNNHLSLYTVATSGVFSIFFSPVSYFFSSVFKVIDTKLLLENICDVINYVS